MFVERTRDGLAAARERHGGQLPARGLSISHDKLAVARRATCQRGRIAEAVGISRATLYRALPPGGRRAMRHYARYQRESSANRARNSWPSPVTP